jgi:hypothetical protein
MPSILSLPCRAQLNYQPTTDWIAQIFFFISLRRRPHRKHRFILLRECFFRGNVFAVPLLRNVRLLICLLHSNGCTLCLVEFFSTWSCYHLSLADLLSHSLIFIFFPSLLSIHFIVTLSPFLPSFLIFSFSFMELRKY